jgi:hypothetical protein
MKIKNIKIITLSLLFLMAFTLTSYSQEATKKENRKSGFVFGVVGGSTFNVTDVQDDFYSMNFYSTIQTGYLFGLSRHIASTFLLDLGYSTSSSFKSVDDDDLDIGGSIINKVNYHNFQLGISQSINFGNFSIGIGGGAKFPLAAYKTTTVLSGDNHSDSDSAIIFVNKMGVNYSIVPYAKATLDYSLFIDTRTAITLGLNFEYIFDTGNRHSIYNGNPEGFYIGGQMGIKLAPR